jgi:hypothetical protein
MSSFIASHAYKKATLLTHTHTSESPTHPFLPIILLKLFLMQPVLLLVNGSAISCFLELPPLIELGNDKHKLDTVPSEYGYLAEIF